LDPDHVPVHEALGDVLEQKGRHEEAIDEWQKAMVLGGDKELAASLGEHYAAGGFAAAMRTVAQKKLERLRQRRESGAYVPNIEFVRAYVRMQEPEKAFAALARACEDRNVFALILQCDPFYEGLRKDERFLALLERNGLL
jgi:tetratricopeptide (TPR) repeat protein